MAAFDFFKSSFVNGDKNAIEFLGVSNFDLSFANFKIFKYSKNDFQQIIKTVSDVKQLSVCSQD